MNTFDARIIREIAQSLVCGENCYLNKKTQEIITIPNDFEFLEEEFQEVFEPFLKKIKKNKEDYIKFETLESFESFRIMENFALQLQDIVLKEKLLSALKKKKPFGNFKHIIDYSDQRANWFCFEQEQFEKYITSIIEAYN